MSLKILLVEDDRELRTTIRDALQLEGYHLITAASLAEAKVIYDKAIENNKPLDLVLLDLGLPDGEGQSLLMQWRSYTQHKKSLPVIVISARDQEIQKIQLLDAGADDYLVKPFGVGELLARIRVSLRHRGQPISAAITRYQNNQLFIDLASRRVELAGKLIHLTPKEFDLLALLVRHAGRVLTHRQLLNEVWGPEFIDHTHYLRLYMAQLRAKLERDAADPQYLLTEPGVGYRLAEQ